MHALLRVLFTINPSYQYIRAGSPGSVPVVPLPDAGHNASTSTNVSPPTSIRYGTVSLKPCMEAIRRSSPELIQNRDFTIYVLDPLEANSAPPMVQIPQHDSSAPQIPSTPPGTVAVGYGLMSEALAAKDEESPQVVGTFTLTHGRESIEVVLTLRESVMTPRNGEAASKRGAEPPLKRHRTVEGCFANVPAVVSTSTSARSGTSSRKTKVPKPPKPQRPMTESERLLQSNPTYFGPPKKKGRPRVDKSSSALIPGSDDFESQAASSAGANGPIASTSTQSPPYSVGSVASTSTSTGIKGAAPDNSSVQNILALIPNLSPEQRASSIALLNTLGHIDADPPAFAMALKQLLRNLSQHPAAAEIAPQHPVKSEPHDDEIVLLDKENINPTAFRKRSQREKEQKLAAFAPVPSSSSGVLIIRNTASRPQQPGEPVSYFGSGSRSNTIAQRVDSAPTSNFQASTSSSGPKSLRKRTLSEFMEEKEAKSQADRTHESSSDAGSSSPAVNLRYYPRMADNYSQTERAPTNYYRTGFEPFSSPPRPTRSTSDGENSNTNPIVIPDSPIAPRISASSPPKPSASKARKKFTLPEWARTGTATQPRLSEEAQRAMEAQERKKEEKLATKRRGNAAALAKSKERKLQEKQRRKSTGSAPGPLRSIQPSGSTPKPSGSSKEDAATSVLRAGPIAATTSFDDIFASSSPSDAPTPTLQPPRTPPRTRTVLPCTPSKSHGRSSLFTPTPKSFGNRSPLFSPTGASPCARRQSTISPTKSPLSKNLSRPGGWGDALQLTTDESEREKDTEDDFLSRELESDSEPPTTSLLGPTSDVTIDDQSPSANDGDDEAEDADADLDDTMSRVRQQWDDLPPSSPPPPTSPCLPLDELPSEAGLRTDDESEYELPTATSDFEPDEPNAVPSPEDFAQTPEQPLEQSTDQGLDLIMQGRFVEQLLKDFSESDCNWLDQYTTIDALSSDDNYDGFSGNDLGATLEPNPDQIDMTELWGEMGRMVANQVPSLCPPVDPAGTGLLLGPQDLLENYDLSKVSNEDGDEIARKAQSLLSGCVL
ncbi:hypothetical protein BDN72DRAFT_848814 [Pluteus cervinus]|uniref:Uncharacterized protein n=2 Tax=Pluteus cervinus TaxID=181527 RepID=A0ACD3A8X9_9AGAR|nr:hypothetical protein BDN72DRAFT_848870 [Pluteus cervinus]TFK62313.1 hypothetical protein BDN72DRAFT_848814 [Pluteus cervinus]